MLGPDTDVRLRHRLDAAREAVHRAQGKTRTGLDANRPLNLSLVRLLEIVGLRNRRIHGYDNVDFAVINSPLLAGDEGSA
jgi:uncharacterized protein with HEPN domain